LDGDEPVSSSVSRPITEEAIVARQETSSGVEAMARVQTNFHENQLTDQI
jgi:hypothetical protein